MCKQSAAVLCIASLAVVASAAAATAATAATDAPFAAAAAAATLFAVAVVRHRTPATRGVLHPTALIFFSANKNTLHPMAESIITFVRPRLIPILYLSWPLWAYAEQQAAVGPLRRSPPCRIV